MKAIEDLDEVELRDLTNGVLNGVKERLPAGTHFAVLFWPPEFGVAQYGSNCRRADMIKMLRETADRLDRRQDVAR